MFKRSALLATILGVVISGTTLAHSDFEEGGHEREYKRKMHQEHARGMGGMKGLHRAFSHLDLSAEQKESLKSLKQGNKEAMQAGMKSLQPLKKQMHELLTADDIDEAAVKALSAQIAEKKAEQMLLMASIKKQAIAILNDEQRAELEQMQEKRRERMAKHRSHD